MLGLVTVRDDRTLTRRLAPKVSMRSPDQCWIWTGGRVADRAGGYGQIWSGSKVHYAHRAMYELLIGPIPEGLQLDHLCRNHQCVNPTHLEPVTMAENIRRGWASGEHVRWNRKKTHCPRGHGYDATNTYIDATGRRHCRSCRREKSRGRQRR